jgi:peptidyl-prolyl cis-trans isomerase SurA
MNKMYKKISLSLVCSFALWFTTCSMVQATIIDRIVAIVNNDIITSVELNGSLAPYLKKIEASGYTSDKKMEVIKKLEQDVLNTLIDEKLTQQEAKRLNISVSDEEVTATVKRFMASKGMTKEAFEKALSLDGMTWESYTQEIKEHRMQNRIINRSVRSKVIITDEDVKRYYNAHIDKYQGQKKYHLRNILDNNEAKLKKLKLKLDNNEDFSQMAIDHSIAPNASEGGDLGVFDIDMFSINIKESISKLKKGEFTDVVTTFQGYQIFYVEDILLDGKMTIDQAKPEIQQLLFEDQVKEKFMKWLTSLKEKAHIKKML